MKYRFLDQIVGAFLVFTLVLVIVSLVAIGRGKGWFKRYDPYYAVFQEGYGLRAGSKVEMLNIEVGKVTGVEIDASNRVRVFLKIAEKYANRIRTDSVLTVVGTPFLGASTLSLSPGSPSAEPLPKNSRIPSKERKTISDYIEYLKTLDLEKKVETLTRIMASVERLTDRLSDPKGPLFQALNRVNLLLENLNQGKGTAGKILTDSTLYDRANQSLSNMGPMMDNLRTVSERMVQLTSQAGAAMEQTQRLVRQVSELLIALEPTIKALPGLTEDIRRMVGDLPPLLEGARRTLDDAGDVLGAIKNNAIIRMTLPPPPSTSRPLELDVRGAHP